MLRVCTSVCLAAGVTTSAAAFADPPTARMAGAGNPAIRDVTVTGCVAPASQPNAYILSVIDDRNDPATPPGGAIAAGTPLRLVGLPAEDFQDYVGQQVEVFGMVMSRASSRGPGPADRDVKIQKLGVRYIRQLAATCAAPATTAAVVPPGNTVVAFDNRNGGKGRSRGSRDVSVPLAAAPGTTARPGTATPSVTTPTGTTRPATAQPVSNTSPTPGVIGTSPTNSTTATAPTNSTTANAGLGQSGISGNATLGGAISMTTPTFMFPIGRPAPGSTQAPLPVSTQSPVPGSTQSTLPGATPSPVAGTTPSPLPVSTVPGTSTLPGGFAQGASNTTTTNAALDQFGLSGDALLSGLVNVNVQQLLASVQVQANLNVQDVIVNLSDILNDNQIQALVQALNTNPQAALNANDLTSALQGAGVLNPSELVVGVTGSQIYANKTLTDALQSRGIIQPTETIMTTAVPHVFVVGPGGGGQ